METPAIRNLALNTSPFCYYNDIQELVFKIHEMHNLFSKEWCKQNKAITNNLKKLQVRHICKTIEERNVFILENNFYFSIKEYINDLEYLIVDTELDYIYQHFDLRLRVKQNESIVNKLKYYQLAKEGEGSYPLNKCLNDLLGFRIIIEDFDHTCSQFDDICNKVFNKMKIKKINSSKGEYKATHLYFYGEYNRYYPWELQIWNPLDATTNENAHTIHKQEYKKWAQIYKDSIEIERSEN